MLSLYNTSLHRGHVGGCATCASGLKDQGKKDSHPGLFFRVRQTLHLWELKVKTLKGVSFAGSLCPCVTTMAVDLKPQEQNQEQPDLQLLVSELQSTAAACGMGRAPQNAHVKSAQDASFPSLFLSFLADILAAANAVPQSSSEGIALFAGALCKSHSHPTPQQLALLPSSKIHLFPALVCLMLHCSPVCPLCAIPSPLSVSGTCDYNETALRLFCYFTWQRDFANVTKGP